MVDPNDVQIDTGYIIAESGEMCSTPKSSGSRVTTAVSTLSEGNATRPKIFDPSFVAANQQARTDNTIEGKKQHQMEQIRADISDS